MHRWLLCAVLIAACGSEVTAPDQGKGGAKTDSGCYDACIAKGSSPEACQGACALDGDCYDACIAKGEPVDVCAAYCSGGVGGKGSGTGGKTGVGGSGAAGSSSSGSGAAGGFDVEVEKSCVSCWYDETVTGGACQAEATACQQSLACTQLQWCPSFCGKPGCLDECNAIIPSGVAPLTALVQCVACDGGPCAEACNGSVMLQYCN